MGLAGIRCWVEWSNGMLDFDLIGMTDEDKLKRATWIDAPSGRQRGRAVSICCTAHRVIRTEEIREISERAHTANPGCVIYQDCTWRWEKEHFKFWEPTVCTKSITQELQNAGLWNWTGEFSSCVVEHCNQTESLSAGKRQKCNTLYHTTIDLQSQEQ